jgi:hypothetical protein
VRQIGEARDDLAARYHGVEMEHLRHRSVRPGRWLNAVGLLERQLRVAVRIAQFEPILSSGSPDGGGGSDSR